MKKTISEKEKELIVKALLTEINSYNSYKNLEFVESDKIQERQEELLNLIKNIGNQ